MTEAQFAKMKGMYHQMQLSLSIYGSNIMTEFGEEVLETIASSFAEAKKLLQESDGDSEALREMGVLPGGNAQSNGAREREGGLSRSWVLKRSREARR